MFNAWAPDAMGLPMVDRQRRVAQISQGWLCFLPGLVFAEPGRFAGCRVEDVVPHTGMAHVIDNGQPILVDLLTHRAGTLLVSRPPLRVATGQEIGAVGFELLDQPETTMQSLIGKHSRVQRKLESARRQLWPSGAGRSAALPASWALHGHHTADAGNQAPDAALGAET